METVCQIYHQIKEHRARMAQFNAVCTLVSSSIGQTFLTHPISSPGTYRDENGVLRELETKAKDGNKLIELLKDYCQWTQFLDSYPIVTFSSDYSRFKISARPIFETVEKSV